MFETLFPDFQSRNEVRGGLSGLAQIRGWRGDTPVEQRFQSDLEYISTWSFWKDLVILCRTPAFLVRQKPQMCPSAAQAGNLAGPREEALDLP